MSKDDFSVLACKLLAYLYGCLKAGVKANARKAKVERRVRIAPAFNSEESLMLPKTARFGTMSGTRDSEFIAECLRYEALYPGRNGIARCVFNEFVGRYS